MLKRNKWIKETSLSDVLSKFFCVCYSVHLSINTLVSRLGLSEGSSGFGEGTYGNQLQYNACTIMMTHFMFATLCLQSICFY